jgi:hypothetical protein
MAGTQSGGHHRLAGTAVLGGRAGAARQREPRCPPGHRQPPTTPASTARAERPRPGGRQLHASDVLQGQVPVLTGTPGAPNTSHVASGSHRGYDGSGNEAGSGERGRPQDDLDQPLERRRGGMHDPATLATAGMGGAAHSAVWSAPAPWTRPAPAVSMLGHRYVPGRAASPAEPPLQLSRDYGRSAGRYGPLSAPRRRLVARTRRRSTQSTGTRRAAARPGRACAGSCARSAPARRRWIPIDQAPAAAPLLDAGPVGGEWVHDRGR